MPDTLSFRRGKSSSQRITTRSTRTYTSTSSNPIPPITRYPHALHGLYSPSSTASSARVGKAPSLMHGSARAAPSHPTSSRCGSAGIIRKTRLNIPGRQHDTVTDSTASRNYLIFTMLAVGAHFRSCSILIATLVLDLSCCIRPLVLANIRVARYTLIRGCIIWGRRAFVPLPPLRSSSSHDAHSRLRIRCAPPLHITCKCSPPL